MKNWKRYLIVLLVTVSFPVSAYATNSFYRAYTSGSYWGMQPCWNGYNWGPGGLEYTGYQSDAGRTTRVGVFIKYECQDGVYVQTEYHTTSDQPSGEPKMCNYFATAAPPSSCTQECQDETTEANANCPDGWEWDNEETCSYVCNDPCEDELEAMATTCGGSENVQVLDWDTCEMQCDCDQEKEDLEEQCSPWGITNWDNIQCTGSCDDCEQSRADCVASCGGEAGIYDFDCYPDPNGGTISTCSCYDENGDPPPDDDPTEDGEDNGEDEGENGEDPADDQPDPEDDPEGDPDDGANGWLKKIKKNTDKIIDQNKDRAEALSDIVSNTDKIADNQGKIKEQIRDSGQQLENELENQGTLDRKNRDDNTESIKGGKTLGDVVAAINNSPNEINIDLSQLATGDVMPEVPQFDSTLPTDYDYTQYDDVSSLATDYASTVTDSIDLDPENAPVNAQVTASGDACIDGSVTLHGSNIPVNICFNHPWMLQGYAIMKILFIGLAYLQTAILLNKAIIA